jgi:uncharacterized protein YtpQ (UPF0354 family)
MPSKSKAQQRLFGMAHAIRKGELDVNDAPEIAQKLADSNMTDKQIRDFAATNTKRLPKHVKKKKMKPIKEFIEEKL